MREYSLWLQPEGPLRERLQAEIQYFADAYGGPIFEPHVTLVPGYAAADDAAAVEAARAVAQQLKAYAVRFDKPSYGTAFFQCVYILCHKDAAVLEANAAARRQLGLTQPADYMPHLSLLYSDVDERIRRSAAELASRRLFEGPNSIDGGFQAASLTVWAVEPEDHSLGTWTKVAELPLQGS